MKNNLFDNDPDWDKPIESFADQKEEKEEEDLVYIHWSWKLLRADQTPYKVYGYEFEPTGLITVIVPVPAYCIIAGTTVETYQGKPVYETVKLTLEGFLWINSYLSKQCLQYYQKEN